ncbi:DNA polymerase III subunit delta [Microvirga thermotolerans]|uniref:DNA polymerase III subunit delta n=1 Tax=Microvirga thermotolerans TaxID=2651334 RepID=A0A5P9JQR1_9HYPH|nr:DNA polymerase III subunit delta [Microvirga thermotolerans]QFU14977.1 DNA polymerase III subunit delta [Microvirga thermotolerans]
MVAVKAGDVDGVLRRPHPGIGVFLLYGPDTGLVNERARAVAERSVDDPSDPFQLIRIDGDDIAADPARLADEALTIGLFGGRRAIWVKATSRNIAPAVEMVLKGRLQDTAIVIEGGDLAKSAPLRVLCERAQNALALPCYADTGRDLGAVVDETLKSGGFAISREARAALLASLGGDRLATRGELAKLMLYAHGRREITLDDVDAVLSDVSSLAMDAVVDAAFAGQGTELETGARRLAAEGVAASTVLGAALRHALMLLPARLAVEEGKPAGAVVEGMRSLHFRRKPLVERHLQRWSSETLRQAIALIQASLLDTRRLSDLDHVVAARTLLDIARTARR